MVVRRPLPPVHAFGAVAVSDGIAIPSRVRDRALMAFPVSGREPHKYPWCAVVSPLMPTPESSPCHTPPTLLSFPCAPARPSAPPRCGSTTLHRSTRSSRRPRSSRMPRPSAASRPRHRRAGCRDRGRRHRRAGCRRGPPPRARGGRARTDRRAAPGAARRARSRTPGAGEALGAAPPRRAPAQPPPVGCCVPAHGRPRLRLGDHGRERARRRRGSRRRRRDERHHGLGECGRSHDSDRHDRDARRRGRRRRRSHGDERASRWLPLRSPAARR